MDNDNNDNMGLVAGSNAASNPASNPASTMGLNAGSISGLGALHATPVRSEWHRRLALGLSAQLPDNAEDARAVLDCIEELVESFLYPRPAADAGDDQDRVLLFVGAPAGISSCRTR